MIACSRCGMVASSRRCDQERAEDAERDAYATKRTAAAIGRRRERKPAAGVSFRSQDRQAREFELGHRPVGLGVGPFGLDRQAGRAKFQHRHRRRRILSGKRRSEGFQPLDLLDKTLILGRDLPGGPIGLNGLRRGCLVDAVRRQSIRRSVGVCPRWSECREGSGRWYKAAVSLTVRSAGVRRPNAMSSESIRGVCSQRGCLRGAALADRLPAGVGRGAVRRFCDPVGWRSCGGTRWFFWGPGDGRFLGGAGARTRVLSGSSIPHGDCRGGTQRCIGRRRTAVPLPIGQLGSQLGYDRRDCGRRSRSAAGRLREAWP